MSRANCNFFDQLLTLASLNFVKLRDKRDMSATEARFGNTRGFTLIELLAILLLIGLVMGGAF